MKLINPFKLNRSLMSLLAEEAIKFSATKKRYSDPATFAKYIVKAAFANEKRYVPPMKIRNIKREYDDCGMQCFELCNCSYPQKILFYIHGGAYIEQPLIFHWIFLDRITDGAKCKTIVPMYPQAPANTFERALNGLTDMYVKLAAQYGAENIILSGDSAGGGLALALAMEIRRLNVRQPKDIILICPWLDITMSNPDIKEVEALDPMLGVYGLTQAGKLWAGKTDPKDPRLSPIYGSFENLGRLSVFIGTHELFLPDARKFRELTARQNVPLNYYGFPEMNHVFPMFPVPEAREAIKIILQLMEN